MKNESEKKEVKTNVSDTEIVHLKNPLSVDGEKLTTITLRLGELTGADMEGAEAEAKASTGGEPIVGHEMSKTYLLAIASRAARININDLRKLGIKDASTVTLLVQGFLLS